MSANLQEARASIIIPAHNEAAVIARTLGSILRGSKPGEFEILVVCNGCSDDTAQRARRAAPHAKVLESAIASKTAALNLGNRTATAFPRIYLDADLEVSASDLRALLRPLEKGEALAAVGQMAVDLSASSYWVRAFYRVWRLNPYFDRGKFGGLFALSRQIFEKLGGFPDVTADDEYLRCFIAAESCAHVPRCRFIAHAPHGLKDLLKIRRRSRRGTRELERQGLRSQGAKGMASALVVLRRAAVRPLLWPDLAVYYAISIWVRLAARSTAQANRTVWERDDSSRLSASQG